MNREIDRLQKLEARTAHIEAAHKALALHRAGKFADRPAPGQTAGEGMRANVSRRRRYVVSGRQDRQHLAGDRGGADKARRAAVKSRVDPRDDDDGAARQNSDTPQPPSPGFFGLGGLGRHGLVDQSGAELLDDLLQLLRLGLEVARMRPLERRLERAPDLPVGIAEMVVDGRIFGLELDRALEVLHRLVVFVDAVVRPAERIHDVAVVRPLLDGAADHPHALVEIDALIDPRIAEIVEHVRPDPATVRARS